MALEENITQSFVVKFKKKEKKLHPLKFNSSMKLSDDPDRRLELCESFTRHGDDNPIFLNSVALSDEATFYLNGTVNRHNCRYWALEQPHLVQAAHPTSPKN